MIVSRKVGDILESNCDVLCITVNSVGVMGKGMALDAKNKYPGVMRNYKHQCATGRLRPGGILPYPTPDGKLLLLVATKDHWAKDSQLEWIEQILERLVKNLDRLEGLSIAVPPLGCGNGNLDFKVVEKLIYKYLDPITNSVELYTC